MLRSVLTSASAGLLAIAASTAAIAATAPVQDSFSGGVTGVSGTLKSAHGDIGVVLYDLRPASGTRSLKLLITGRVCASGRCDDLGGKLPGTLTPIAQQVPDVGRQWTLRAAGKLGALGRVTIVGPLHGTGFIARGQESLDLTLTAKGGALKIDMRSGLVPGFTGP